MVHLPNGFYVWLWRAHRLGCEVVEFPERLYQESFHDTDNVHNYRVRISVILRVSFSLIYFYSPLSCRGSPTFFSAANFIILGQIVQHTQGEIYSRLSPKRCT